jgi:hypothetical protein
MVRKLPVQKILERIPHVQLLAQADLDEFNASSVLRLATSLSTVVDRQIEFLR